MKTKLQSKVQLVYDKRTLERCCIFKIMFVNKIIALNNEKRNKQYEITKGDKLR